ncbi:hypothetical protein [Pseudidiomarina taiwanensis]|uniref:hypothetical protein n=1 Tax=Pseudidiomarina taiwanensis TaxID=337250 RepID=UPI0018E580D4|nr:hypothetical protein [Pseudidiomarina taiwanensis]
MQNWIKLSLVSAVLVTTFSSHAALPPDRQNMRDLNVMISFINANERVAMSLETIDFSNYTIHFGGGCQAIFERKEVHRSAGWVGPAAPLEFARSTCKLD